MAESRKPLMAGNWKMNLNHLEATSTIQRLAFSLKPDDYEACEVLICAPFTDLRSSIQTLVDADRLKIHFGAQDVSQHDKGAYTGEISGAMLAKLNCTYVIVGHSERREYHHETNHDVNAKAFAALRSGLTPIICFGEPLEVREKGDQVLHALDQVSHCLAEFTSEQAAKVVLAYEPIWAIGTGLTASPTDAQEVCGAVRGWLADRFGSGRRRQGAHPVRRLDEGQQRRQAHGAAGHRRRPGRRGGAGPGRVRPRWCATG